MCMPQPYLPEQKPFTPAPAPTAPPPAASSAATVQAGGATSAVAKTVKRKNPLRTDSGATDSVATGLNIPS